MDYNEAVQRQRQIICVSLLGSLFVRFIIVAVASIFLVKIVSLLLAHSSELHALELIAAANAYIDKDGGSGGGDSR